jgi:DNA gyrase/topoisomerase IV subunit A
MTNTINVNLAQQVQEDYLAYSLSVIVGRAFPRYTDGCKTISRRIMTAMRWLNLKPEGRYMKSARVEGEVMGKLSPHGGSYSSIVTLAAPWNNMVPLVDGHLEEYLNSFSTEYSKVTPVRVKASEAKETILDYLYFTIY